MLIYLDELALIEGVTVLLLARLYGIGLTIAQQVTVVLIRILGGIGTAGGAARGGPVVLHRRRYPTSFG
jgi:DAACS family dicarboxylate/amino acid:cation (Na+ or H+) symporter